MLALALLFACGHASDLGPVDAAVPRAADAALGVASGEVIVRPECFELWSQAEAMSLAPPPAQPRSWGGSGRGTATTTSAPGRKPKSSPRPRRVEAEADAAAEVTAGFAGADLDEVWFDDAPAEPGSDEPEAGVERGPFPEHEPRDEAREDRRTGPVMEWGGTTWLSNDDSMSLASAQRVLWAAAAGQRAPVDQIRPHELLNYFSFDTDPVRSGRLFSVKGSAARVGEESLSVALAVQGATPPRKPLDLTVVVDRSGSMSAEGRMEYTKRGLARMGESLEDGDRVDLVLFDDEVCTPLENFVVGRDDPALLTDAIARIQPRNATDLDLGLKEGYRIATPRARHGIRRNRRVMVITDAFLNTGDVDPHTVSEIGRAFEEHDIRLSGVGVGREFNDAVLDMLTEKGKGAYVYLGSEAVVDRVFGSGFDSLTRTIAHDVRFSLDLPPSLALARFYGEESSTRMEDVQPVHYYAGTSQVFLQDLAVDPARIRPGDPVKLTITYREAATGEPATEVYRTTVGALLEADPHNLDKSRALMAWTDLLLADAMGAPACGEPARVWAERAALLPEDAEIAYVDALVRQRCGALAPPAPVARVDLKVVVDSDVHIPEVALWCGRDSQVEALTGSDQVARFQASPGSCDLVLAGVVPMRAPVEVPATGAELRCLVRAGRVSCH